MVTETILLSVVAALFASILGAYAYVHRVTSKSRGELIKALKENKESLGAQVDRLENHFGELSDHIQKLEIMLTNRLTRIETHLGINPKGRT